MSHVYFYLTDNVGNFQNRVQVLKVLTFSLIYFVYLPYKEQEKKKNSIVGAAETCKGSKDQNTFSYYKTILKKVQNTSIGMDLAEIGLIFMYVLIFI